MIFPNRVLSEKRNAGVRCRLSNRALSVLLFCGLSVAAGEFTTGDLTQAGSLTDVLAYQSAVHLAPRDTIYIALAKDEIIPANTVDSSYGTDVTVSIGDTLSYYWTEWNGTFHRMYTRYVYLEQYGFTMAAPRIVYNLASIEPQFFHAARGASAGRYAASFFYFLTMHASSGDDSISWTSQPNSAICHLTNDTFCIVYKEGNAALGMRLARISGASIDFSDSHGPVNKRIAGNGVLNPLTNFSNSSVASDSSGNILVTATRGSTANPKSVQFILTDKTYAVHDSDYFAQDISLNSAGDINYADVPVCSYANGKFAAVYWTSAGVYLCDMAVAGAPKSVTVSASVALATGATFRAPAIASNGKKLLVVWKNLTAHRIEGKLFSINNGSLSALSQVQTYSQSGTSVGNHGPELNVAINEKDNIALSWKQNKQAVGAIWAARGVMHPSGVWISPVESVSVAGSDSLVYLPGIFDTTLNGGAVTCSLQVGPSATPGPLWSQYCPLGDSSGLAVQSTGINRYFRLKSVLSRNPADTVKGPVFSEATVRWNFQPAILSLDSIVRNSVKVSGFTGFDDTVDIISHTDSITCFVTLRDRDSTDSTFCTIPWNIRQARAQDTVSGAALRQVSLTLAPGTVWDTVYSCSVAAYDLHRWNAPKKSFLVRARKSAPEIDSVKFDGVFVADSGTQSIIIGKLSTVGVRIERPAVVAWNRMTYRFKTIRFDTSFTVADPSAQLAFLPAENDMIMWIIVTDAFGASDTSLIYFNYPKYTTDTTVNPGYAQALRALRDSIALILGRDSTKSVTLPVMNTGNDTLRIDSIFFRGSALGWLRVGVLQDTGIVFFDSLTATQNIAAVKIEPDSTRFLHITIDAARLVGDGVLFDTILIFVNDPLRPADTIAVMMEYNDLPVMRELAITFDPGLPYWEDAQRRSARKTRGYAFPPHGKLKLRFSEPMDSASVGREIFAYSVREFARDGVKDTIDYIHRWSENCRTLTIAPEYRTASDYYGGLLPQPGTYIPTDSVALIIRAGMHDRAATPSSPNYLDLHSDYRNDPLRDTTVYFVIDPVRFTIDSVLPAPGATTATAIDSITLFFSGPIYPGTVDTARENNRTLLVTTKYVSYSDSTTRIGFSRVRITGSRAVFVPAKRFFYGDSIFCYYRGVFARDSLGYPSDMNNDGVPAGFFDSTSAADDYHWSFTVPAVANSFVTPAHGAKDVLRSTPITVGFSAPVLPGSIDTSLTENRSLFVASRYNGGMRIDFDSIAIGTNSAIFYLNRQLFYNDSVWCMFNGLSIADTHTFSVETGMDSVFMTDLAQRSWSYRVRSITLVSVSPESASARADIHDAIILRFSGPVSAAMFDTATDADSNNSFSFMSGYGGGNRSKIRHIGFSSDSTAITIQPRDPFYSYDSIWCRFAGFNADFRYTDSSGVIPGDSGQVILARTWYFFTKNAGFYTFPNPYKPGSNRRHRDMGGIMFKNLHAIRARGAINAVRIRVYSMNIDPVFESPLIRFEENNAAMKPEWLWNTRNSRGVLLASGVYFYAIFDAREKVLLKGKILIVR